MKYFDLDNSSNKQNSSINEFRLHKLLASVFDILSQDFDKLCSSNNIKVENNFYDPNKMHDFKIYRLEIARKIYSARRIRDNIFKSDIFSEPAWDILLGMYIAHAEMRQSTVKSVYLASCVAMTTALRWTKNLEERNLIMSVKSSRDKRVRLLELTPKAISKLEIIFDEIAILYPKIR